jgi:hypothetical protein
LRRPKEEKKIIREASLSFSPETDAMAALEKRVCSGARLREWLLSFFIFANHPTHLSDNRVLSNKKKKVSHLGLSDIMSAIIAMAFPGHWKRGWLMERYC